MNGAAPVTLAVIGGGVYVPRLARLLAAEPGLPPLRLALAARRRDRLEVIAASAAREAAAAGRPLEVVAASRDEALDGADIVVPLLRVGGLRARAWDERFPRRFGLVGDEGLGPGGMANAWRTYPVMADLGDAVARLAPRAWVLNMVAPLGPTTRLLLERGCRAVGLCELPLVTRERLGLPAGGAVGYGGLNHLGWFWPRAAAGREALARAVERGLVDRETWERFGAAPLHYYYGVFRPEAARRLGCERDPGRARALEAMAEAAIRAMRARPGDPAASPARPTPWFDRALVPVVRALLGGPPHEGHANLRNAALLPAAPAGAVVEVAARFDAGGVAPRPAEGMPPPVARFVGQVAAAEEALHGAALRRDLDGLAGAIAALPLPIDRAAAGALARLAARDPVPAEDEEVTA